MMTTLRVAVVTLVISLAPLTGARENCEQLGIFDVYHRLLPPGVMRAGEAESITLRYIPGDTSTESEFEFRIATTRFGVMTMEVIEPLGSSVQSQFMRLKADSDKMCDEAVVSEIVMERRQVPADIAKAIRRELVRKRIHVELEGDVYLDTARYEVWFMTPMNEMSWVLYGPDSRKETHPLIDWAKASLRSLRSASGGRR